MNLKTQLKESLKNLPKRTLSVLLSVDFHNACENLFTEYNITSDKRMDLEGLFIYNIAKLINKIELKSEIDKLIGTNDNSSNFTKDVEVKIINNLDNLYVESLNTLKRDVEANGGNFNIDEYINSENEIIGKPLDPNLEQRIMEISNKYNLNKSQTDIIIKDVNIFVNKQSTDISPESIVGEIGTSSIIAEQVALELKSRIFDYIEKQSSNTIKALTNTVANVFPATINITNRIAEVPAYIPKQKVVVEREPVQSPIAVPRFKAVPLSDNEMGADFIPKLAPKPSAGGIMESKLNSVTAGITEVKKETPPILKNYSTDPYREPIN